MPDDNLMNEAADWCVRLHDTGFDPDEPYPDVAERNEAFFLWVRQSFRHYEAFMRIYDQHSRLGSIDPRRQKDIAALLAEASGEIANRRPRHVYRLAAAVAAAALLGLAAYFASPYRYPASSIQVLSTNVGEVRHFALIDGSLITLDTDSRVEVKITLAAREVEVVRGGALISVFHDPKRPFTTCAGGVWLADVGTQFAAETHLNGVGLDVTSGAVEIRGRCPLRDRLADQPTIRTLIRPGEHANIDVHDWGLEVKKESRTTHQMDVDLACYRGVLILESIPLSKAISQVNRYLPRKLVLAEPALADIPYGGTVNISVLENSFLSSLKRTYSIIPDPKRKSSSEVFLIPAPGHPLGGPY